MTTFKEIVEIEKKAQNSLTSYERRVLAKFEKEQEQLRVQAQKQKEEIKKQLEEEFIQKEEHLHNQAKTILENVKIKSSEIKEKQNIEIEAKKIVEGVINYV